MLQPSEQEEAVLVVSEKLTDETKDWKEIPKNHFVVVDTELKVRFHPIRA